MLDWLEFPADHEEELTESARRRRPADDLLLRGDTRYFEGDFLGAADAFHRARRHDPTRFPAWAVEIEALVRAERLDEADAVATEALDTYGQVPVFYAAKAILLAHQGHLHAAYEHSDIAVHHHEASLFTWLARGEVVLAAGRERQVHSAETCFESAARRDPTDWEASFRAAIVLFHWDLPDRARQRLESLKAPLTNYPFLWKLIGDCHRRLDHPLLARENYQHALALRPDYAPARTALRSLSFRGRLRNRIARLLRRGPRTRWEA
jgi:tetratricopeptide (TPR) repeat protein